MDVPLPRAVWRVDVGGAGGQRAARSPGAGCMAQSDPPVSRPLDRLRGPGGRLSLPRTSRRKRRSVQAGARPLPRRRRDTLGIRLSPARARRKFRSARGLRTGLRPRAGPGRSGRGRGDRAAPSAEVRRGGREARPRARAVPPALLRLVQLRQCRRGARRSRGDGAALARDPGQFSRRCDQLRWFRRRAIKAAAPRRGGGGAAGRP